MSTHKTKRPRNHSLAWLIAVQTSTTLDGPVKAVAAALFGFMNADGSKCFPGIDSLSDRSGFKRRAVENALHRLRDGGWLDIQKSRGMKVAPRAYTSLYTPLIPDPDDTQDMRIVNDEPKADDTQEMRLVDDLTTRTRCVQPAQSFAYVLPERQVHVVQSAGARESAAAHMRDSEWD